MLNWLKKLFNIHSIQPGDIFKMKQPDNSQRSAIVVEVIEATRKHIYYQFLPSRFIISSMSVSAFTDIYEKVSE
jgi:hypothetical protein